LSICLCSLIPIVLLGNVQKQAKEDSLINLISTSANDTIVADALNKIAWIYIHSNPDTAFALAEKQSEFAERAAVSSDEKMSRKGRIQMSNIMNIKAVSYWVKGEYENALYYFQLSLDGYQELNHEDASAKVYNNIGALYYQKGEYPLSLEYYLKALTIHEKNEYFIGIANVYNNIGLIHYSQGELELALEYMQKTLAMNESIGNTKKRATQIGNIGMIYWQKGNKSANDSVKFSNYQLALEKYQKALELDEEIGNKNGISRHLNNIGIIYKNMKDYEKALEIYLKANRLTVEIGNRRDLTINLGDIALLYLEQGKYTEAENYFKEALGIASSIGYMEGVKDWNLSLSDLYERIGQYQKSYDHYREYSVAKDSLFNEGKSKEIGKLEAKYEFEKQEIERKRLEEEKRVASARAEQRRNNLQYSGILIFIVLIFAGIFMLGKVSLPVRLAEGIIFFAFLLFFEFSLVLLDPYIEKYSSGAPAIKLAFNAVLAALIFPLHSFFEQKLKNRMAKN